MKQIICLLTILTLLASCHSSKQAAQKDVDGRTRREANARGNSTATTRNKPLRKKALKRKYASMLGVKTGKISNKKLYYFIDDWYGVRYKWGGNDQAGVDCSGFAHQLYRSVYGLNIKRTVTTQHATTRNFRKQRKLREGDLVYFREADDPSHVGIYLQNGHFVHSANGKGVHISSLKDGYWKKAYMGGGKVKRKKP